MRKKYKEREGAYHVSGMESFHLPASLAEAGAIQEELSKRLDSEPWIFPGEPFLIAGMDVSYGIASAYACIVTMEFPGLSFRSRIEARSPLRFPYIPGFLAFREIPALLEACTLFTQLPDLLLIHGHGYAHPRRIGLATHLGAILHTASIGIAASPLAGMEVSEPGDFRGASSRIMMNDEVVGILLRSQQGVKPICVSSGYRTTLAQAQQIVLQCCSGSRFPDPMMLADRAARRMCRRCERYIV